LAKTSNILFRHMADRMGTGHLQKYLNQVQKLHFKIMIYNIIIFKLGISIQYQGP